MGVHDGHRERLRSRFREHGLENFNELNTLEILLFYAIPRRDTNPIAHALLDKFGSLDAVLNATLPELMQVPGVGENAAMLISLVPQVYRNSKVSLGKEINQITSSEQAGKYFVPRFLLEKEEVLLMVCLDDQKRVIKCVEVSRGTINSVPVNTRRIIEHAIKNTASSVIIAHNHPNGIALPSKEDDAVTMSISRAFSTVGISLDDHIVVAGEDFVSYRDSLML